MFVYGLPDREKATMYTSSTFGNIEKFDVQNIQTYKQDKFISHTLMTGDTSKHYLRKWLVSRASKEVRKIKDTTRLKFVGK